MTFYNKVRKAAYKNRSQIAIFIAILILFPAPQILYIYYSKDNNLSNGYHSIDLFNKTENPNIIRYIDVDFKVSSIDTSKWTYDLHLDFHPSSLLKDVMSDSNDTLNTPFIFQYGSEPPVSFKTLTDVVAGKDFSLLAFSGHVSKYPWDKWNDTNKIAFRIEGNSTEIVVGSATLGHSYTSMKYDDTVENSPSFNSRGQGCNVTNFEVRLSRSLETIAFSIFIQALMWFLSIFYAAMTYKTVYNKEKLNTPLATGTGLLFSMGTLRSTQPGVPEFGCDSDTYGFVWNVGIVALCVIILIGASMFRNEIKDEIGLDIERGK